MREINNNLQHPKGAGDGGERVMSGMEITIKGTPREIADLVQTIQWLEKDNVIAPIDCLRKKIVEGRELELEVRPRRKKYRSHI